MAFEDRLTASVRGVEFLLEEADGESGRRAIPHAYPKKERGFTDDNGAVLNQERINGRVIGDDYVEQLLAILEALNKPGPAEMIHPWFGVRKVQIGKVSHKLINRVDGTATISFEAYEVGENLFPTAKTDTAEEVKAKAKVTQEAAIETFEKEFDELTVDGVLDMVDQFLEDMNELINNLASLPEELGQWIDKLETIKKNVNDLIAIPGELAREAMGMLEDIKSVVKDPLRALDVYNNVINRWNGLRAELGITGGLSRNISSDGGRAGSVPKFANPSKNAAMIANANAFKRLVLNSAVASQCTALADANIVQSLEAEEKVLSSLSGAERDAILTGQQLKNIGYGIADRLAEYAADAVENNQSQVWRSMRALRQSVISDTRARAELLPQVTTFTPINTVPVALVAWQKTNNTERRDSIVSRNGLKNPGFILPSESVEVID